MEAETNEHGAVQQAQRIVASGSYQQGVNDVLQSTKSCADCICAVSGIGVNEAKLAAYYCAATYKQSEKKLSSPLSIIGSSTTGKSQIMEKLHDYSCNPSQLINAKSKSYPDVRDITAISLKEGNNTIFIEEADRCIQSNKLEEFIYNSYSRTTSDFSVKRAQQNGTYVQDRFGIFVSFIEHRRTTHNDGANARRAVVIETHQIKDAEFPMSNEIDSPNANNMALMADIILPTVTSRPKGIEGGIWNNWQILIKVAMALGDTDWLDWAVDRMKADSELLKDVRQYEPQVAILGSLVANLTIKNGDYTGVRIGTIVETIRREYGFIKSNMTVSQQLKRCGIEVHLAKGVSHAFPTKESLKKAADDLGLDEVFLDGDKSDDESDCDVDK